MSNLKSIKQFHEFFITNDSLGIEFNPPVKKKEIKKFESDYGWEFPDQVQELLMVFNGEAPTSAGACAGLKFCSLDTMMKAYSNYVDIFETVDNRVVPDWAPFLKQEHSWSPDWIPIAEDNICSNVVYLDPFPSSVGKVGQIFLRDDEHYISGVKAVGIGNLLKSILSWIQENGDMPRFNRLPDIMKTTS